MIRGTYKTDESEKHESAEKDMHLVTQLLREFNMVNLKALLDRTSITYIDERDILRGSFGPEVDALIGKSPINGPDGYTFRKITYSVVSAAGAAVLFTFKVDRLARGTAHVMSAVSVRTTTEINADQQGGAGITTDNKLVTGDLILASILRCEDGRSVNSKQGTITGSIMTGSATTVNSANVSYGTFPASVDQQAVQHQYGAHVRTVTCAESPVVAVCNTHFNIYSSPMFSVTTSHTEISAPILSIGVGGFAATTDAQQVRATLTIYALCGPRPNGMANVPKDPSFRLQDLERFNVKNPVVTSI